MLNKISIWIVKGFLTLLPFALTIYFITWVAIQAESLFAPYIPDTLYVPGLGVLCMIILLALIGAFLNAYLFKFAVKTGSEYLERVPVVKTIFGAVKDAVELFQIKSKDGAKQAVLVEIQPDMHLIGFITNHTVADVIMPGSNKVAVYMPMSYQLGGYTIYVDSSKVSELDIDVETAMRIAITGGNSINPKTPAQDIKTPLDAEV